MIMKSLISGIGGWFVILGIALVLLYSNGALKEELGKRGVEISQLLTKQDSMSRQLTSVNTLLATKEKISKDYIIQNSIILEDLNSIHIQIREGMMNELLSERNDCRFIPNSLDGLLLKYEKQREQE